MKTCCLTLLFLLSATGLIAEQLPLHVLTSNLGMNLPDYSKIEFGLNTDGTISGNISARITAFLTDQYGVLRPGTVAYDQAFQDGLIINPYDPDQISVDVVLNSPTTPHIVRHGFYYVPYERIGSGNDADWQQVANEYPWRIRFTPDEIGQWSGYVNIWVGGQPMFDNYPIEFKVVASASPGIIDVSKVNPHYFAFSESKASFVPIGSNYAFPTSNADDQCHTVDRVNVHDKRVNGRVGEELNNFLQTFSFYNGEATGNCTRLLFTPETISIERERLENYTSRQHEMWELDQYVSQLEEKHVRLILGQHEMEWWTGQDYHNANDYNNGWNWNPYNDVQNSPDPMAAYKGVANVNTLYGFLTDPTCRKFYKARLRYMEARWGYSTSIFMYDILNEAAQMTRDNHDPSPDYDSTVRQQVEEWVDEMAGYLKNELKTQHLTGISCGDPGFGPWSNSELSMWQRPNIDVVNAHLYFTREGASRIEAEDLSHLRAVDKIDKPAFVEEMGSTNENYDRTFMCTDITEHDREWASLLAGYAGPDMVWSWRRYNLGIVTYGANTEPPNYNTGSLYYGEYDRNYKGLRLFADLMDPASHLFLYSHTLDSYTGFNTNTMRFETFTARRTDTKLIYGWVHNRSDRSADSPYPCLNHDGYATMADVLADPARHFIDDQPQHQGNPAPPFYDEDHYVSTAGFADDVYATYALSDHYILLDGMTPGQKYFCNWYWTWGPDGGEEATVYAQSAIASGAGSVKLIIPPTAEDKKAPGYPGDWAFILSEGSERSMAQASDAAPPVHELLGRFDTNAGRMHALFRQPFEGTVQLFDATGRVVSTERTSFTQDLVLSAPEWSAGVYIISSSSTSGEQQRCSVLVLP